MTFSNTGIILKEFTKDDLELLYSVFSNEEVMKFSLYECYQTKEAIKPYFDRILKHNLMAEDRPFYEYRVYDASNNQFIGFGDIEVQIRNEHGGSAEIGYFLLPEFWGQGYATKIANTLCQICFEELGFHKVSASCNINHVVSEKIMRKIGMKKEGTIRALRCKEGEWQDEFRYGILIDEWKK